MRPIKFRGMDVHSKWHYGNLSVVNIPYKNIDAGCYISNSAGLPFAYLVRKETIGQFTGLLDKNGKEIYEGDICKYKYNSKVAFKNGVKVEPNYVKTHMIVGFTDGCFHIGKYHANTINKDYYQYPTMVEVIGNIYESKYLMEIC